MRTKAFVMTMGVAACVWVSGCQTPAAKHTALPCASGSCAAPKTKSTDTMAARPRPKSAVVAAGACNSCAKCGAGNCETLVAVKASAETSTCTSCSAKTDGREFVVSLPSVPIGPAANGLVPHQLPNAPSNLPAAIAPGAPSVPAVTSNYGPGVDVVAAAPADTIPAGPAPGEKTLDANNVMTVRFGHANNYQIVVGQVYQFRRTWRLRYTAIESDDKYGGSFTLTGDGLDNLKDGQMVRVEGAVLPSDDRVSGSRYQVNRVEVLEPDVK